MKRYAALALLVCLSGCAGNQLTAPSGGLLPGEPTTGPLPTPAQIGTCAWMGDEVRDYLKRNTNIDTDLITLHQTGQKVYIYKVPRTGYRWEEYPQGCKGEIDVEGAL